MRLICPNCGAQYDVPANVIPEAGRDVQCSGCGHTWFQRHPDADPDLAEELDQPLPEPEWTPEPEPEDTPQVAAGPVASVEPEPEPGEAPEPAPRPPAPPAGQPEPPKRDIDPEMAELFREEREFEARRRAAEALESQPELGLTEPDDDEHARRSREARERMARMRGEEPAPKASTPRPAEPAAEPGPAPSRPPEAAMAAAAAAGSRRDLLPDVEEINQTLRSSSEPRVVDSAREEADATPPREKGGFGRGVLLGVVIVVLAILLYVYAATISEAVPPLAPLMDGYMATVDGLRGWLDEQMMALLRTLDGMSSEAPPDGAEPAPGN